MATANPSYASTQNAVYNNSNSQFVDLATRLRDTIATLPAQAQRNWHSGLRKALTAFKRNHPNLKNFSDRLIFPMCRAIDIALSEITIDCTGLTMEMICARILSLIGEASIVKDQVSKT